MSKKLSTYVPSEVNCSVLGLSLVGFDKDSFITITPMNDRVTYRKSPSGRVTAFIDRNQVFEVEIKLVKTSPSNAFLQLVFDMYLKYGQLFKLPLHINGGGVKSDFFAGDSFIKVEPTSTHGSSLPTNTWKFICFNASYMEAGSDSDDGVISEIAGAVGMATEVMNMLGVDAGDLISKISSLASKSGITSKISGFFGK